MSPPLIRVSDLTIGWSGEPPILERASFEVQRGEIFAILGGSGCGKSTLLRYLEGLEEPLAGEIVIAGTGHPRLDAGRPPYGVMFQQGALIGSLTVGQNVALPIETWTDLPRDAVRALVRAKLRLVGLLAAEGKLPSELSGGMKKRVAIARAMALEPSLLFLDEPSSGLDPITSAGLDELILTLRGVLGLTVVLVTHELGSIFSIVDRCILLDREAQRIAATGRPRDLQSSADPLVGGFFNRRASTTS